MKYESFADHSKNSIAKARKNLAIFYLLGRERIKTPLERRAMEHIVGNLMIANEALSEEGSTHHLNRPTMAEGLIEAGASTEQAHELAKLIVVKKWIRVSGALAHIPFDAPELYLTPRHQSLKVGAFIEGAHGLIPEMPEPTHYIGNGRHLILGTVNITVE